MEIGNIPEEMENHSAIEKWKAFSLVLLSPHPILLCVANTTTIFNTTSTPQAPHHYTISNATTTIASAATTPSPRYPLHHCFCGDRQIGNCCEL
jgi:hypothetical protein